MFTILLLYLVLSVRPAHPCFHDGKCLTSHCHNRAPSTSSLAAKNPLELHRCPTMTTDSSSAAATAWRTSFLPVPFCRAMMLRKMFTVTRTVGGCCGQLQKIPPSRMENTHITNSMEQFEAGYMTVLLGSGVGVSTLWQTRPTQALQVLLIAYLVRSDESVDQ